MKFNNRSVRSFLAANSANGFVSFFDELAEYENTYVIKGGPGTGKSSFMKKIASAAQSIDLPVEYVFCSSDPSSLDAIGIKDIPLAILDGTPPHTAEPKYPGAAGGIINAGEYWNEEKIKKYSEDVFELTNNVSDCFSSAYRHLKAVGAIYEDIEKISEKALNAVKLNNFTDNLIKKIITQKVRHGGEIKKRFISGITPDGIITFYDTIYALCERVIVVKDKYLLSDKIVSRFANAAKDAGYTVYAFHDPLLPQKTAHVAVPEISTAIVSNTFMTHFEAANAKAVNMSRFIEDVDTRSLSANQRLLTLCLKTAIASIAKAKAFHNDLEDIYISAMDFTALNKKAKDFAEKYIKRK